MAGGQQITSGIGSVTPSESKALTGQAVSVGAGTVVADAGNGIAISGSATTAAQGTPVAGPFVQLRSRKVGGGSAQNALTGSATTTGQGRLGSVPQDIGPGVTQLNNTPTSATWVQRYTQDFEDGSISSQFTSGAFVVRTNITGSNVIGGTRSYRYQATTFPANAVATAIFDLGTWLTDSNQYKRFRLSVTIRAETTATTIFLGIRQALTPFGYQVYEKPVVNTTPQTFTWDFILTYTGSSQLRIDLTEISSIIIDDILLEEDTSYTGFIGSDTGPIPDYFAGVHINNNPPPNGPNVNYKVLRGWELCAWRNAEPTQGAYDWTYIDQHAQECLSHGAYFMLNMAAPPLWAVDGQTAPPAPWPGSNKLPLSHMTECVAFLTAAYSRFQSIAPGKFKFVEVWNESDQSFFLSGHTAGEVLSFTQQIYTAVKNIDPTITVIAPNTTINGSAFYENYLRAGGDQYCDAYSIHVYPLNDEFRGQFAHAYNFRQILNRRGVSTNKPLFNTEGAPNTSTPGAFARAMAACAMSGMKGFYYYNLEGTAGGQPLATAASSYATNSAMGDEYNTIASWLAGHTLIAGYGTPSQNAFHMVLTRPDGGTRIVAFTGGSTATVSGQPSWGITTSHTLGGSASELVSSSGNPVMTIGLSPVMFDNVSTASKVVFSRTPVGQAMSLATGVVTRSRTVPLFGSSVTVSRGTVGVSTGGGVSSFSWNSTGADSYEVGWDTVTHAGGDVNDPTLYPNRINVGTALSWTNTTGLTVFARVRSVVSGEVGPWSSVEKGPINP